MKKALWGIVPVLILGGFISLKLCKVIAWSWWWVFSPVWVPLAIVLIVAVFIFLYLSREMRKNPNLMDGTDDLQI